VRQRRRTRLHALAVAFFVLAIAHLYADAPEQTSSGPYSIRSVDFEIHGISIEFVLRGKIDIAIDETFATRESLDAFVEERRQRLVNERVLAKVEASYFLVPEPEGGNGVYLVFATWDTWNIVALPYFKYDSNKGLLLSARARDFNFLGSMRTLSLNLDYRKDEVGRDSFGGSTSLEVPFRLLGAVWVVSLAEELQLWSDGTPTRSVGSVSLGFRVPGPDGDVRLTASQGYSVRAMSPDPDPDPWFLSSSISVDTAANLGLGFGYWGQVEYSPRLSLSQNWRPGIDLLYEDRSGLVLGITHGLSFGRVDWIGNLRSGLASSLTNSSYYNISAGAPVIDFDFNITGYAHWANRLGAALRVMTFSRPMGKNRENLGSYLRGVLDYRISACDAAFLNLTLPIKLIYFPFNLILGTEWLDFELQVAPFLDAAFAVPKNVQPDFDSLWYTSGLEVYVFPKAFRSFIVRASLGVDLYSYEHTLSLEGRSPRDGASIYEVYFGLGLMY
jgi:hypothetical protein